MFRSGFFLSVSGPAALLTVLIQPTVRQVADQRVPSPAVEIVASTPVSGLPSSRIASTAISPTRMAAIPSSGARSIPAVGQPARTASDKDSVKTRRPMQEGCERAISSLAGPEARRMVPGRCMT